MKIVIMLCECNRLVNSARLAGAECRTYALWCVVATFPDASSASKATQNCRAMAHLIELSFQETNEVLLDEGLHAFHEAGEVAAAW